MKKSTKRLAVIIALTLAALMVFSLVFSIFLSGGSYSTPAIAASAIDQLKEQQKVLAAEKKRNADKRAATVAERKGLINQKHDLDEQIRLTLEEIENTNQLIHEYTVQIALTQERLQRKNDDIKEKEEKFLARLRAMEEAGDVSYISILMQSKSFSDLLGRISIISEIAAYDQKIISDLQKARDEIAAEREQLEIEKLEQLESRKLLSEAQSELAELYRELDQQMAELEADIKEYEKAEAAADKEMEEAQKKIQQILAEEARKAAASRPFVGGTFANPAPDYTRVSSEFGMRNHPILKVQKKHTGIDLASPSGTRVLAANDGTVIMSEWNGGYGNCIAIDHGGKVVTLYAHNSKNLVKKGDTVKKGQRIANIGSTGTSTGPHLHFEYIVDGTQKNPREVLGN
ncbi:MAG: peptidoglycan DD-metalloendopeptidase family protein [Oscillospiraceae bacterium]|nr:peptidoglycan DD-metalloendopeptidase family protein [Oscillospiraceae bacterium]